jgi:hypothetical protein
MKSLFLLLFCCFFIQKNFAQPGALVGYKGVDNFFINDPKSKFSKFLRPVPGGNETWGNNFYTLYQFNLDSVKPVKIDTVQFQILVLNFIGDSTLSDFIFTNIYIDSSTNCNACKYSFKYGEIHLKLIKLRIEQGLGKEGKYINYVSSRKYTHYGYLWQKKGIRIKLSIQYDALHPKNGTVDLIFATKYSPYWQIIKY